MHYFFNPTTLLNFFSFFVGIYLCIYLQLVFKLSNVVSAAIVGFIAALIHPIINKTKMALMAQKTAKNDFIYFESLLLTASFIGMDTRSISYSNKLIFWPVILKGLIGYGVFLALKNKFTGIGGRIGFMAFSICAFSFLIITAIEWIMRYV